MNVALKNTKVTKKVILIYVLVSLVLIHDALVHLMVLKIENLKDLLHFFVNSSDVPWTATPG